MPRRRPGSLLPLEIAVLEVALAGGSTQEFHGFSIAKSLQNANGARRLTAHGTLYKALARMEKAGLLTSRWEEPDGPLTDGRPRRRLYLVTGAGAGALHAAQRAARQAPALQPGLATS